MDGRFEVRGTLGTGGAGVVYRAFDKQLKREVALKMLRQASGRDLYRFKREFRALADIVHPNLVTLHELQADDGDWFFTMELVLGVDFVFRHFIHGGMGVGGVDLNHFNSVRGPIIPKCTPAQQNDNQIARFLARCYFYLFQHRAPDCFFRLQHLITEFLRSQSRIFRCRMAQPNVRADHSTRQAL